MTKECKKITKKLIKNLRKEKKKLDKKIHRLDEFMDSPAFELGPQSHKDLLGIQLLQMAAYSNTIKARINFMKEEK